ncbi:sulfatase-like hydrolase/transferase [Rhizobium sp. PAMB 3182]
MTRLLFAGLFFLIVSFAALTLPDHASAFSLSAFQRLPLEIPLLLLALLLLPRRLALVVAAVSSIAVFTLLFLKIADIGVQSAFQRRFNPYLDIKMLGDGWNIFSGSIGRWPAGFAVGLVIALFCLFLFLFYRSQCRIAGLTGPVRRGAIVGAAGLLVLGTALWLTGPLAGMRADLRAGAYLGNRLVLVQTSIADMRQYERDLVADDPTAAGTNLFAGITGRDVVVIFVESYGRSAIEDPRYSPLIKPRLAASEAQLKAAGFASASGWSRSPTMGGLSWLAHGTFLSGLWTDNQARYDRLMISKRASLNSLFRKAGWRTAAVMPAITMDWPEARYFGYDDIFAAKDLGYKGKPFNWITMPDQYTLSAFQRLVRDPARAKGQPVMTEMALISSHAPWTPVAKLIDWNDVGDGTAFNGQAESDESPRTVWSDGDNVRRHYIATIDYSLQTLSDYISRFGDNAIFVILGDHQPAPIVTGPDASRAVPVHIISRDAELIARFEKEGFVNGMLPSPDAPELPMDTMRDRLIRVFSQTGP